MNTNYSSENCTTIGASARFKDDLVRGGISYRFNWTPFGLIFGRRS